MACYRCDVDGCDNAPGKTLIHYQKTSIGMVHTRCKRCFREQLDTDQICEICSVCGLRCFYPLDAYGGACYECFATFERHPKFSCEYMKNLRLNSYEYWQIMYEIDRNLFQQDVCADIQFGDGVLCEDADDDQLDDVIVDNLNEVRRDYARFDARLKRETVNKISILF